MTENRLILAYNVRDRNEKLNARRLEKERATRSLCSVRSWRMRMIDMYNSRQENTHVEVAFPLDTLPAGHLDFVRRRAREVGKDENLQAGLGNSGKGQVDTSECVLAFAAFGEGRGVEPVLRPFSNKAYQFLHLRVTRQQYTEALLFATKQIGKPFDSDGASWRLMVWPVAPTHKRWWCASLSHAILKRAGLLLYYQLNTLDVDDVVRYVKQSKCVIEGQLPRQGRLGAEAFAGRMFYDADASKAPRAGSGAGMFGDVVDAFDSSCQQIVDG
jgi:hypothetical protein